MALLGECKARLVGDWHVGTGHGLHVFFCVLGVLLLHEHHLQDSVVRGTNTVDK